MQIWPSDMDIHAVLGRYRREVTGLYIGDYKIEYLRRGIVRQSTYADKILIVDPFAYASSLSEDFNPMKNPSQHRAQTLKNANFWFEILPWIQAGIVEVIRTPGDLDPKLNWELLQQQKGKFENNAELSAALDESIQDLKTRQHHQIAFEQILLSAPDDYIRSNAQEYYVERKDHSAEDLLRYIQKKRDNDPNFLEPLRVGEDHGQLHAMTTGMSYEMARLTAEITGSYLCTDLKFKWKQIEFDRAGANTDTRVWSPFAKAFQDSPLRFLNNLSLAHALTLRKEQRLESLRRFLSRTWKQAQSDEPFSETNAILLADELLEEIRKAEYEWAEIDQDLLKMVGAAAASGALAAGPLIASGLPEFFAAYTIVAGATTLAVSTRKHKSFPIRCPAAFFMNIKED